MEHFSLTDCLERRLGRGGVGLGHLTPALSPARRGRKLRLPIRFPAPNGRRVIEVGDFGSRAGNATRKRVGWELAVKGATRLDIAAQFVQTGAELKRGA